ncbi:MAG: type II toxin-antitoxin system YafQ family toxin [Chloroflexi bacterium]|nr:type II toxin-antitoxin system YafQ family toxin [Chloroflexota bacterium]
MRKILSTGRFRKDFKRMEKRGVDSNLLEEVLEKLCKGETLDEAYKDHLLQGRSDPERECHITPDWLLIYVFEGDKVRLVRTGTHSDLFK